MGRSRNIHQHEIFYFKERLLACLSCAQNIVSHRDQQQAALQALLPLLHRITDLEVRLAFSLEEQSHAESIAAECQALAELREGLIQWSEHYMDTHQWLRLQSAVRQKRRRSMPNWMRMLRKITAPEPVNAPRWLNPMQGKDLFASRLLVPRRHETQHPRVVADLDQQQVFR